MQLSYQMSAAPVSLSGTAVVTLPPFLSAYVILTGAAAGAVKVSPMPCGGPPFILPAGSGPGVYKLPCTTDINTTAALSNAADASLVTVAVHTWSPVEPQRHASELRQNGVYIGTGPMVGPSPAVAGSAVFMRGSRAGNLCDRAIASGVIGVLGVLGGPLVLRSPNGWTQTIAAGAAGLVPLVGLPSGPGVTFAFSNNDDPHSCDVVASLTFN